MKTAQWMSVAKPAQQSQLLLRRSILRPGDEFRLQRRLLEGVQGPEDLGELIGGGLYTREVDYLCSEEWAFEAQDILWRRSKLGLFTSASEQEQLQRYLDKVIREKPKIEAA